MDESDPALPSPAPASTLSTPSAALGNRQTGPADPSTSVLPAPMSERADANAAAPAADLGATAVLGSDQTRPDGDSAAPLSPPVPDRADTFEDEPDDAARNAAQELLPPGDAGALGPVWDELADRAAH